MKNIVFLCMLILPVGVFAQDNSALTVEPSGKVVVAEDLEVNGSITVGTAGAGEGAAVNGTLSVSGDATMADIDVSDINGGNMTLTGDAGINGLLTAGSVLALNGVQGLRLSQPIAVYSPDPPIFLLGNETWTSALHGNFHYYGGTLLVQVDYSAYHGKNYMVYSKMRLDIKAGSSFSSHYLPNENGWMHHSNENESHIGRSLTFVADLADGPGEYEVHFETYMWAKEVDWFQIDVNDYITVTILEIPN